MKSKVIVQQGNLIYTSLLDTSEDEISAWCNQLQNTVKAQFEREGPVKILTDLTNVSFTDGLRIRKTISEMEKKNEPYVLKSAAFTPDIKIRWLSRIIAKMSGRKNFGAFKTKENAFLWLQTPDERQVLKETFYLVYNYVKDNRGVDEVDVLNYVRKMRNYSGDGGEVNIDIFNMQQGAVYVSYNYLKEKQTKSREDMLKYIEKNYDALLNKYYLMEK